MGIQKLDSEFIQKVIRQDRSAQFQLFELTKSWLFSVCFRIVGDEDEANDVLQEAYVEIFQNIRKLNHHEALNSWMKTITVRKAIQQNRKKIYFEQIEQTEAETTEDFDAWFDSDMLDQAIQSLPAGARTVFTLIEIEGYPHKECSQILGISESTSKSQLNYSKKILKRRITKLLQA